MGNRKNYWHRKEALEKMINVVLVLVIIAIVGGALIYIRKEKKRGVQCVGCPHGGSCGGKCSSCNGNEGDAW